MLEIDIARKVFSVADSDDLEAIRDLKISVASDSFTSIVGPSGCGKSTTLRILLGLDKDYEGHIDLAKTGRVAAVFQEPCLLPWRSVEDNVRLALPTQLRNQSLDDLFAALGLAEMRSFYPSELSLGLARRASLARAFATEPGLLVLDEPFVSLDEETATRLRSLLNDVWQARPVTALMVTHNLREAIELSDRIVFLSKRPAHVLEEVIIDVPRAARSRGVVEEWFGRLSGFVSMG